MNRSPPEYALADVAAHTEVALLGSRLQVMVTRDVLSMHQGPFTFFVPRHEAKSLAEALRAPPRAQGECMRDLVLEGERCVIDASALRTVKTVMLGAFILALPEFAAQEIARLLERFAASGEEVGHA